MAVKEAPKKNPSPMKRVKQSEKKGLRNQAVQTKVKTQIGKLTAALLNKDKEVVDSIFKETIKVVSSAASKHIIHKNTASRKISRIARKVNALKAKDVVSEPPAQTEAS